MPRFSLRTLMVVMLLGGPACGYLSWYLWMGERLTFPQGDEARVFRTHIEAIAFRPAGKVESLFIGHPMHICER